MRSRILSILIFLTFCSFQTAFAWERTFDFEQDSENFPPDGMIVETAPNGSPIVNVQSDPDPSKKSKYLMMQGSSFPGVNSLLCIAWFSNVKDGNIQVSLKHGGEKDVARTAGFVWRYQSTNETYRLEWDTQKSTLTLALVNHSKRKILKEEDVPLLSSRTWSTLGVKFHGSDIQCEINGKSIFKIQDSEIANPGKVGLLLQSDVPMFFDNFKIQGDR